MLLLGSEQAFKQSLPNQARIQSHYTRKLFNSIYALGFVVKGLVQENQLFM